MDKRLNFLALALIDALEDENYQSVLTLMEDHNCDPNFIVAERHLAPIHFSCGMENLELAHNTTKLFLKNGADPNLPTPDDGLTPLHIAAMSGRQGIVRMLLENGGSIDIMDKENRTPLQYAVFDYHFEVIETIKKFIFEKKINEKQTADADGDFQTSCKLTLENKNLKLDNKQDAYTPNKTHYNFDVTSPYYVNITHRRKDKRKNTDLQCTLEKTNDNNETTENINKNSMQQSFLTSTLNEETTKKNLFELTEDNLCELTKNEPNEPSRISLIQSWRDKVHQSRNRQSIIYRYNNLDNLLDGIITNENVDFTNTSVEIVVEKKKEKKPPVKFDETAFGKLINFLRTNKTVNSETSFTTALAPEENKKCLKDISLVEPHQADEFLYQMSEKYQYIDRDEGLVFFEEKLAMNTESQAKLNKNILNSSHSTISTQITVPTDYDTEVLRDELIKMGENPGPITKSTKRLYTKRLTKYKKDPEKLLANQLKSDNDIPQYSIELLKTVKSQEWYERISEYSCFEDEMCEPFKNNHKFGEKKWREGNIKQSFIYFLIDPRISQNLPAKSKFSNEFEIWKQFLTAIFYVGKGKSVRPYCHLYEAMKIHMRLKKNDGTEIDLTEKMICRKLFKCGSKVGSISNASPSSKKTLESEKLTKILDIWKSDSGVICLHVFHNILPAEAYTREAAIIDTLGLNHLTNMKRGDYYGPASAWTMRKRKSLGVALLLKAMKIFLAEGESQLFPSDLI